MPDYLLRRDAFEAGRVFFLARGRYLSLRLRHEVREQDYQDVFGAALKYELALLRFADTEYGDHLWAKAVLKRLRQIVSNFSANYNLNPPPQI